MKCLFCLLLATFLFGCGKKIPVQLTPHYVASQNYSSELAKWKYYSIDQPDNTVPADVLPRLRMRRESEGTVIPKRSFTPLEKKHLGVWVDPATGNKYSLENNWSSITMYVNKYGKLPTNSEELLAGTYLSARNLNLVASKPHLLPRFNHIQHVLPLVNPATGKPYDSFQSKTWTPFGIDMQIVSLRKPPPISLVQYLKSVHIDGLRIRGPRRYYSATINLKIYGEKPRTVLYTTTLYQF